MLLAAIVLVAVLRARQSRRLVAARGAGGGGDLTAIAAVDHRGNAERHAAAGEWAVALREWLRAAVRSLEERGVLDPVPGRTPDEIARIAGGLMPAAADTIRAATSRFDEVWFGGRPAESADAEAGRAAADAAAKARIERPRTMATAGYQVPS